jgi:tRNA-specific 2-thiouridylase
VTRGGEILATHDGIDHYTVGQRRGLRVGGQENPLYVLEIDPYNNLVIVGQKHELERSDFLIKDLTWVAPYPRVAGQSFQALAQLRHRHKGVKVEVLPAGDGTARVTFLEDWSTVSPGQACVLYDLENEEVFGGGRIVNG